MTRRFALLTLVLGSLAACDKKDEMSPESLKDLPPPEDDEKRLRRPPPAGSRMGSDPDNPNGVPGGRVGTSSSRY